MRISEKAVGETQRMLRILTHQAPRDDSALKEIRAQACEMSRKMRDEEQDEAIFFIGYLALKLWELADIAIKTSMSMEEALDYLGVPVL